MVVAGECSEQLAELDADLQRIHNNAMSRSHAKMTSWPRPRP